MPLPIVVGAAVGAATGGMVSYVMAGGSPTKRELLIDMGTGAIPGAGLGLKGGVLVYKKGKRLAKIGKGTGTKEAVVAAIQHPSRFPYASLRPAAGAVGLSVMAGWGIGGIYDQYIQRVDGGSSTGLTSTYGDQKPGNQPGPRRHKAPSSEGSSRRRRSRNARTKPAAPSRGMGVRPAAPWCWRHKKRHWCSITRGYGRKRRKK